LQKIQKLEKENASLKLANAMKIKIDNISQADAVRDYMLANPNKKDFRAVYKKLVEDGKIKPAEV
jgi:hypothetical protein